MPKFLSNFTISIGLAGRSNNSVSTAVLQCDKQIERNDLYLVSVCVCVCVCVCSDRDASERAQHMFRR